MPSHNQHLGPVPLPVADRAGHGFANENDYSYQSNRVYANNRSVNQQAGYYGNAGKGIITETVAPLLDILRPSRKENSIGNVRPYQNAKPAVSQSYLYNPKDTLKTTIKETTVNSKFHLNINANQRGGGYDVAQQHPIHNNRDTTTDYMYIGNSSAQERGRQPTSYESNYNQRNNSIKASTVAGYTPSGNGKLFNGYENVRQNGNIETMMNQTGRAMVPTLPNNSSLSKEAIGQFNGKVNPYSGVQLDRNNGDILSQLQGNPFTLSIQSGKALAR
jgi:hypothetical protein